MPILGWPRDARLSLRSDFLSIRASSKSFRTGNLRWFYRLEGETPRFGFRIPKSNGCAVRRNRLRRVLRENLRLRRMQFPAGTYVILANVPPDFPEEKVTPTLVSEIENFLLRLERLSSRTIASEKA